MTLEETGQILALLAENWKKDLPSATKATLALWQRCLGDLPYKLVDAAVLELILVGSPFCPKISEVRRHALGLLISEKELPQPAEAWEMVRRAVHDNSSPDLIWAALPPAVRRAAQAIGWYELNNGESAVLRAHFLKLYESERETALQEALLPPGFKDLRQDLRQEYGQPESLPLPEVPALPPSDPLLEEEPDPQTLERWQRVREMMTELTDALCRTGRKR